MSNNADRLIAKANESDAKRRAQSEKVQALIAKANESEAKKAVTMPTRIKTSGVKAPSVLTQMWAAEPLTQVMAAQQEQKSRAEHMRSVAEAEPAMERAFRTTSNIKLTDELRDNDAQYVSYVTRGEKLYHQSLKNESAARAEMGAFETDAVMGAETDGLTQEELRTFYYLWGKDGETEAKKYLADTMYQQERFEKARANNARGRVYAGMKNAQDFAEQAANGQRLYRTYMQNIKAAARGENVTAESTGVQYIGHEGLAEDLEAMTDDERSTFFYLWGKGNEKDAKAYRDYMRPELDSRIAKAEAEKIKNMEPGLNKAMTLAAIGTLGSAMATVSELPYMFKNEEVPEGSMRQFVQEAGSDLTGIPYYLYEASKTLGGQLPAIAASGATGDLLGAAGASLKVIKAIAKTVGAAVMGLGAAGRAKQEMLREGYSLGAANAVGVLTGVSETTLERVLGGIDKFSGGKGLTSVMKKNISGIRSGVVRWLLTHGANVLDEITEEELQLVLEPLFKSLVTSAEFEAPMTEDYIDTAITTALSTFLLNVGTGAPAEAYNVENDPRVRKVVEQARKRAEKWDKMHQENEAKSPEEQLREAVERRNEEIRNAQAQTQQPSAQAQGQTVQPVSPQEMVQRAMQARTARNETRRTGILAGAKESDIRAGEILSDVFGRRVVFYDKAPTADGIENGFYDEATGTIHINVRSENVFAQIFSHELTHSIEKSRAYRNFSRAVLQQIGKTGDIVAMREEIARIYARNGQALKSEAAIDRELVAKYVEEHLLTDEESIMRLAQQNRTIVQRIKHWIDATLAALGNAEAKERAFLYRAQTLYAKALKQTKMQAQGITAKERLGYLRADFNAGLLTQEEFDNELEEIMAEDDWETVSEEGEKKNEESNKKNYSITEIIDENGKSYGLGVLLDSTLLDNLSESERKIMVRERIKELGGTPFTAYDLGGNAVIISIAEPKEKFVNEKGKKRTVNRDLTTKFIGRSIKQETVVLADELIQTSTFEEKSAAKHKHDWLDNDGKNEWDVRKTFVKDKNNTIWEATLKIANATDGRKILYDIDPIKKVGRSGESDTFPTGNSISNDKENVNRQYSFSPAQKKTAAEQRAAVEWLQENLAKGEIPSARAELDSKATNVLKSAEAKLTRVVAKAFGIRGNEARQTLRQYAADLAEEYLYFGMVSEHTMQQMFDTVWQTATRDNSEFIAQYEEVKAYLNENGVSISEDIKAEIPDYNEWRKAQMGKLKISKDASPVDVMYQTLSEIAPEQFPPDVNAPTDQLMLMSEMADKLVKREEFLHDMSGRDADEIKRITELDFRACVEDFENEIFKVKKYRDAQSRENVKRREQEEELAPKTTDEVLSMYDEMKKARKVYERVAAKQLLTPNEQMVVGQLLRGQTSLERLDPKDPRSAAIQAVYEARAEFEKYAASVRAYNSIRRQKLYDQADKYLRNMNSWEDKAAGILYARETIERNVADITKNVPEDGEAINKAYFAPVHKNEANATRMKNAYRERVEKLGLSRKAKDGEVSEAAAVQIIGEAQDAMRRINNSNGRVKYVDGKTYEDWKAMIDSVWESSPSLDQAKIQNAINEFRKIYDELFTQMNDARVRNGYEPIDYRSGYFPHFRADTLNTFAKALGIQTDVTELPTTIAGLTHTFKPGIRFIPNALERKGVTTTYDAVEGFDRYIEGVADVVHHTEDIQRLRALASRIRYWASDKGIQEKVDEYNARTDLSEEEKKTQIDELYKDGKYKLSNFVQAINDYTNLLANKKSDLDRGMEKLFGRGRLYSFAKWAEGRVAANMVGVNVGSWLTNFIPLTQAWGVVDSKYMLGGMWQTLKAYKNSDGITERSDFLTNRRGSDAISKTTMQKVSSAASVGMEIIDNFVADSIVRARYEQNLKRGLSEEAALEEADALAASVMADRSKGALPTIFAAKNPIAKLFTQFQVEVNNQLSFLIKDLPREKREEGIGKLLLALLKYAIGAYIYNNIYEAIVGRRPALDPIGILNDTVGDFTGYELPSLIDVIGSVDDMARGDETLKDQFKTEKKGAAEAATALGENVLQEVPFVGGLLGGGRLPISSALPSIKNLGNAIDWTNEQSGKKRAMTIAKELGKPLLYLAPPFGGGQVKKIAEGAAAIIQGGGYTLDKEGKKVLQYPVKQNVGEIAQTALFGKSATKGARMWVESGFASLTAGQTKAYEKMVDLGEDEIKVYDFMQELSGIKESEQYSKQVEQIRAISKSKFSEKAKQEAVLGLFGTGENGQKQTERFNKLVKLGLEVEDYLQLREEDCVGRYEKYADGGVENETAQKIALQMEAAENANGKEKDLSDNEKYRIIFEGNYSTKNTEAAIRATMDEKTKRKVSAASEYGVDHTMLADFKLTFEVLYPNDKISKERAAEVLKKMDLTKAERAALLQIACANVKPENNPFDSAVGKKVVAEIDRMKEELWEEE